MSIPANATEAPTFVKVWRQVKGNAPTFATIWGLILITTLIDTVLSISLHFASLRYLLEKSIGDIGAYSDLQTTDAIASSISTVASLATVLLVLATVLLVAVPAIYYATIWGLILITTLIDTVLSILRYLLEKNIGAYSDLQTTDAIASLISTVGSLPITILTSLASVLMMAVPAIYYATDRCPHPGEIVGVLSHKPLRHLLAGLQFVIIGAVGLLLCIIPGILVFLACPLYVHYVFTTDLNLITCLSKAFKEMFQNFGSYFVVSLLCSLAVIGSAALCLFPVLAVWPMTALYMQNYIHHKGLVRAQELA